MHNTDNDISGGIGSPLTRMLKGDEVIKSIAFQTFEF